MELKDPGNFPGASGGHLVQLKTFWLPHLSFPQPEVESIL